MAVVTPAHQYPLGVTMSLSRRLALLQWAETSDAWIVEDDYDGEYRYAGRPLAPLRALDRSGRVAYVGSFSKVLFPGLRLGYLVMPMSLVAAGERWLASQGPGTTTLGQAVLARFINEGHFASHLRRTRRLYAERQAILVEAGRQHCQGLLDIPADPAGMHLVARPAPSVASLFDDEEISAVAARRGLTVVPLSRHYAGGACTTDKGLMLGYAALSPGAIRGAVRSLADLLSGELAKPAR
jgi:GntR family transcriptional regulator/MocR family aminotransferase